MMKVNQIGASKERKGLFFQQGNRGFKGSLLLLITIMLVLSACGAGGGSNNKPNASNSNAASSTPDSDANKKEGTEKDEIVNLTFAAFGSDEELAIYQKAIDAFEKENTSIKVELKSFPRAEYNQKMLTELAGNNAADVFYVKPETLAKMRDSESLLGLKSFLDSSESYVKASDFPEGFWGGAKANDEIYGVAVDVNPMVLYYNTAIFEELGLKSPQTYYDEGKWTWDTFKELSQKVVESGKKGYTLDTYWATVHSWIFSNGGRVFDDSGIYVLDSNEKAQEALTYLESLVTDKAAVYTGSLTEGLSTEALMMSNQLAFNAVGRWITPTFLANDFKTFDYIPFPTKSGEPLKEVATTIVFLGVNAKTKHANEAMKFLSYYVSTESQKIRLAGGNAVPSVNGAESLITDATVPAHAKYLLDMREISYAPSGPQMNEYNYAGLDAEIKAAYEMLLTGKKNVKETIELISQKVDEKMKE